MDNRTVLGGIIKLFSLFEKGKAKVLISNEEGGTIAIKITDENGNPINESNPLATERPLNQVNSFTNNIVTSSGNVSSGKYSVTFKFSDDFVGTLQGTLVEAGEIIPVSTDYNSVLPQIDYTITAGNIRILTLEP